MFSFIRARRAALALVAGTALAVLPALPASAHVTVSSPDATGGSNGTLVFRVPTESDTASTTGLTIELPADTPFRSVSALAMPGWTTTIERTTLDEPVEVAGSTLTEIATAITFITDGAGIAPGEYGRFEVRVGPFPADGGTFVFPATQTYSDGEVVAWAEVADEGGAEPAHPAPTLTVAAGDGSGDGHGHGGDTPADDDAEHADDDADDAGGSSDTTARVLGIAGLVVGAVGLVVGVTGRSKRARPGTSGS